MRVKVIQNFIDMETETLHERDTEIEVTEKRVEEINSTSYGAFVEVMKEPDKKVGDKNAGKSVKRH